MLFGVSPHLWGCYQEQGGLGNRIHWKANPLADYYTKTSFLDWFAFVYLILKCGFYDYSLGQLFSCETKYAFNLTIFLFSQEWLGNLHWFKWPDGVFSVCHWLNRCVNIFIFIEGWSWEENLLKPRSVVGFCSKSHSS